MKSKNICILLGLIFMSPAIVADDSYSPYADQNYPRNVYFGDTHLHTYFSLDAYSRGNRKLTPNDAYRFAKGETVTAHNGMKARLTRPLDFLVVADHAENMGAWSALELKDPLLMETKTGRYWHERLRELATIKDPINAYNQRRKVYWGIKAAKFESNKFKTSMWHKVIDNAERHNDPGKFTAFIGFEWTVSNEEQPYHLHRVVIFQDGKDKAGKVLPFSQIDSRKPEDLWAYMADYETKTGGDILAIPHNSYLSVGHMFQLNDSAGRAFTQDYAQKRARWEPLLEVTQIKGDSETHPVLSPTDEFADFETWAYGGAASDASKNQEQLIQVKRYEYARSALQLGLSEQGRLGVNPFKFGMIGSTDPHNSLAAVAENNFWGKFSEFEPSANRITLPWSPQGGATKIWETGASGYAAVWATENTREALFAAMKRKETYATTGPRMSVRFFGGWNYEKNDALKPDLPRVGYSKGVPMGGDLTSAPKGKIPSFLIHAVKDPNGANLDRVQVIKGWHDKNGELHEKIYNASLSDGRKANKNGEAPPVGLSVNIKDASYTNSIGDPELTVVWVDLDFNRDQLAFYYVRVLEIPTPRWTAYDAKFFGIKNIPSDVSMVIQERAYTSPIWYSP